MRINLIILLFSLFLFPKIVGQNYLLHEVPGDASCTSYYITDIDLNPIKVTEEVQKNLQCPSVLSIHKNGLIMYANDRLLWYNIQTKQMSVLVSLYRDIDGVSDVTWSPDGKKMMFAIINQQRKYGYKEFVRIMVLEVNENGKVSSKRKFDRPVNYSCGSICSSFPGDDFRFIDDNTIEYRRHELIDDRPGIWETISLK